MDSDCEGVEKCCSVIGTCHNKLRLNHPCNLVVSNITTKIVSFSFLLPLHLNLSWRVFFWNFTLVLFLPEEVGKHWQDTFNPPSPSLSPSPASFPGSLVFPSRVLPRSRAREEEKPAKNILVWVVSTGPVKKQSSTFWLQILPVVAF